MLVIDTYNLFKQRSQGADVQGFVPSPGNFDLIAVNFHDRTEEDTHTPEELLDLIGSKGREMAEGIGGCDQHSKVRG